jgi:hypothetical protein
VGVCENEHLHPGQHVGTVGRRQTRDGTARLVVPTLWS